MEDRPLDELDSELVERARCGDVVAFEAIVRRYQDLAFRVAYSILGSADEAEDATQEGFVRAYRALHRFRPGAPLRPWLLTIVSNAARTQRTAAARRPALILDWSALDARVDPALAPEAAALSREIQGELLAAVESLREDDRQVIVSRYFLGLSESETSAVLGCARGTVKSRLSRGLGRLRQQMQRNATVANRTSDG